MLPEVRAKRATKGLARSLTRPSWLVDLDALLRRLLGPAAPLGAGSTSRDDQLGSRLAWPTMIVIEPLLRAWDPGFGS